MTYEIIVVSNGKHLFAVHERSIRDQVDLIELLVLFAVVFPESEGYEIIAEQRMTTGTAVNVFKSLKTKKKVLDNETLYMRLKKELDRANES